VKVAIDYSLPAGSIKDAVAALATRRRTRELEADIRGVGEHLDHFATTVELPA
jgi:uncharacterized membrane protein